MQQRVALCRAHVPSASVLRMDEPLAALDELLFAREIAQQATSTRARIGESL